RRRKSGGRDNGKESGPEIDPASRFSEARRARHRGRGRGGEGGCAGSGRGGGGGRQGTGLSGNRACEEVLQLGAILTIRRSLSRPRTRRKVRRGRCLGNGPMAWRAAPAWRGQSQGLPAEPWIGGPSSGGRALQRAAWRPRLPLGPAWSRRRRPRRRGAAPFGRSSRSALTARSAAP